MKTALTLIAAILIPGIGQSEDLDLPDSFVTDPDRPDIPLSFSAARRYFKERDGIRGVYRTRLAEALKHADDAKIYLLEFDTVERKEIPKGAEEFFFPIAPYRKYASISVKVDLVGEGIRRVRDSTIDMLARPDSPGPLAHFPSHGIRLFRRGEVIFETSFSLHTGNYYIQYPDDHEGASWVGFESVQLEKDLTEFLPIPKEMMERYRAKYE